MRSRSSVHTFSNSIIYRQASHHFSVASECVKVHIANGISTWTTVDLGHDVVGCTSLMGGLYVRHAKDILYGSFQTVKAAASCIGFVTHHHS